MDDYNPVVVTGHEFEKHAIERKRKLLLAIKRVDRGDLAIVAHKERTVVSTKNEGGLDPME